MFVVFSFFMFFHFLALFSFFLLLVLLFSRVLKILLFLPRLPHDFLLKLLRKKIIFWGVSGYLPFFFSRLFFFFFSLSFSFSISFHVFLFFHCFSFSFLIPLFSFCFSKKCFFLFHFVSLFSFLGCSKSVAALQDSLEKSAHSELALFALYWLVVTFPCEIVHNLEMIRLRVECGGRRVGQVLPSYQNRQIGALDETAGAPQSSLFSLFSSLLSQ